MLLLRCCFFSSLLLIFFIFSSFGYSQVCDFPFKRYYYKTKKEFCSPGDFVPDFYNLDKPIRCEDMEVDHFFAQRLLYDSGVCDIKKLKEMIKDRDNLVFTLKSTNRRKGTKSPFEFAKTFDDPKIQKRILDRAILIQKKYNFYPDNYLQKKILVNKIIALRKDNIKPRFIPIVKASSILNKYNNLQKKDIGSKIIYVTKKGSVRLISLKFGVGVFLFLADGYSLGKYGYDIITTSEDEKQRRLFFSKLLDVEN